MALLAAAEAGRVEEGWAAAEVGAAAAALKVAVAEVVAVQVAPQDPAGRRGLAEREGAEDPGE